jgi:transcriptional regulator with XRE-family HTH domain
VGKDWQAVADAITDRLAELEMTQKELADRSGLSVTTIRQIQRNYSARHRSPRTLADISEGLRWQPNHLARILEGAPTTSDDRSMRADLDQLRREVAELRTRMEVVEQAQREDGPGC